MKPAPLGFAVVLTAGMGARLWLAFGAVHSSYDVDSYLTVARALRNGPWHVYAAVGPMRWPYPPGFFPWVVAAQWIAVRTGLPFSGVIKLAPIAADGALAIIIHREVLQTRRDPLLALAAGGLIAVGPTFVLNSGYHGQIDSVAILPAVLAFVAWRRFPPGRRVLVAGGLAGLAMAIKSPAGLALLALVVVAPSWRDASRLIGAAIAVVGLVTLPFLATTPHAVIRALTFGDVAAVGGLAMVLILDFHAIGLDRALVRHDAVVTLAALAVTAVILRWRRVVSADVTALVLWLVFYSVSTGFFFGYLVWGVPFFVLAGRLRATAVLLAAVTIPTVLFETGRIGAHLVLYRDLMTMVWAGFVIALVLTCLRTVPASTVAGPGPGMSSNTNDGRWR